MRSQAGRARSLIFWSIALAFFLPSIVSAAPNLTVDGFGTFDPDQNGTSAYVSFIQACASTDCGTGTGNASLFQSVTAANYNARLGTPRNIINFGSWYHGATGNWPPADDYMICVSASTNDIGPNMPFGSVDYYQGIAVGDLGCQQFGWDGAGGINYIGPFSGDTSTHIENLSPANHSTTSAPVTIEFDYYINSDDVISSVTGGSYYNCLRITAVYGLVTNGFQTVNDYTYCANLSSTDGGQTWVTGDLPFNLDTFTHMSVDLQDASSTYIGDVFIDVTIIDQYNGNPTIYLYENGGTDPWDFAIESYTLGDSIFASSSFGGLGYSAAAVSAVCNPATSTISTLFINTEFSAADCFTILFTPNGDLISRYISNAKAGLTTHFPIGYITDFVSIVSTTSSSTLTVINATVPNGVIGTGANINLSLNGILNPILNATTSIYTNSSASSTQTLYQITSGYWNIVVYFLAFLYMLRRILGSHIIPDAFRINQFGSKGSLSDSGDEAYRLKEWLYKNRQ